MDQMEAAGHAASLNICKATEFDSTTTSILERGSNQIVEDDPRGDLVLRVGAALDLEHGAISLRVCSRTLARVSPVLSSMLYGSFAEANDSGYWKIDLPEDNPDAFKLFSNIAHGHLHTIPIVLSLDELFELTMLTHYYDATRILGPWADRWMGSIEGLRMENEGAYQKLLWVAFELGSKKTFEITVRRMLMETHGCCDEEDHSPMLPDLRKRITSVRRDTIARMLDLMREMTEILLVVDEKPRWCRHASFMGPHRCESMILGSITFCLARAGLWPIPDPANVNESILTLHRALANIIIHDIGAERKGGSDHGECNPRQFVMERLQRILADMQDPVEDADRKALDANARRLRPLRGACHS